MNGEFARFVICGGIAAAINWLSRIALSDFMPLGSAIVVAYLLGMTTAFLLMKFLVFGKSRRQAHDEYIRFAIVNIVALIQVWLVTEALVKYGFPAIAWHWHAEAVAHGIGVLSPVLTSYLGHRYFSFAPAEREK